MRLPLLSHTPRRAFTLVELLTVMTIIAILAALTLKVSGYVQNKAASSRAEGEIKAMEAACESYKADNGIYPRGPAAAMTVGSTGIATNATDSLDARTTGNPTSYAQTSLYLYSQLSGDTNGNGKIDAAETSNKVYFEFKPTMLGAAKTSSGAITAVNFISDPWGSSYGYSTAYQADSEAQSAKSPPGTVTKGYNPTFDLWSTAGKTTNPTPGTGTDITLRWIKNW